jgi:hypothetical protein
LGAPKMEGQFLASGPMSCFTKKTFLNKVWIFGSELDPLGFGGNLNGFVLDLLDYARFIESA